MASEKITAIVESIKTLSILEVKELVDELQNEFGVTAMAPVAGGAVAGAGAWYWAQWIADSAFLPFPSTECDRVQILQRSLPGEDRVDPPRVWSIESRQNDRDERSLQSEIRQRSWIMGTCSCLS